MGCIMTVLILMLMFGCFLVNPMGLLLQLPFMFGLITIF